MSDEARVIGALQVIQDYCMETEECGVCLLCAKERMRINQGQTPRRVETMDGG